MIREIVEQHAEEAAFLWLQRDRAARAPHYDLNDLCFLDERVEAHLDGLRVAGDLGWEVAKEALSWHEPGELFAAAAMAVERGALDDIALVLDETQGEPPLTAAFASALGWVEFDAVERILPGLLADAVPAPLKQIGIRACTVHRRDPGVPLARALQDPDDGLRAAALQAVGTLGRVDLRYELAEHYGSDEPSSRFWASWSGARLGDKAALERLWAFATAGGPFAEPACAVVLSLSAAGDQAAKLAELRAASDASRLAVFGAAMLGLAEHVPWLMAQMQEPTLARFAGEAFTIITGEPIRGALESPRPDGFESGPTEDAADEAVALDPDEPRRWPDPGKVEAWWRTHEREFAPGTRHWLGEPVSENVLQRTLQTANQRLRALAATELALRIPSGVLFPVEAPGARQRRILAR